jgi:hypothetical protein
MNENEIINAIYAGTLSGELDQYAIRKILFAVLDEYFPLIDANSKQDIANEIKKRIRGK